MNTILSKNVWVPLLVFTVAFAIRAKPFIYAEHFFQVPVDFDEGVYYAASILITKGLYPYRDFAFGHPPGIAWLFSLWHWALPFDSTAQSFALGKIAVITLGSLTSVGIYSLGRTWNGLGAGLCAGLLYATYPEAIASERSIFLEPFINGAAVLALLMSDRSRRAWLAIGLLLALAVSIKLTAVVWIPGLGWLAWKRGGFHYTVALLVGGMIGFLIFVLPWVLLEPSAFWANVIQFQLSRPPDGDIAIGLRLDSMLSDRHATILVFSVLGLCAYPCLTAGQRKFWGALLLTLVLAVTVLLTSKGFWSQYNTLLAAPQALLTAFAFPLLAHISSHFGSRSWLIPTVLSLALIMPLRSAFKGGRARSPEQITLLDFLHRVSPDACIQSFEPAWLIMADRFPNPCKDVPHIIDPYLVMLMQARGSGATFPGTAAAFASPESQTAIMDTLDKAEVIVLGPRGDTQLNADSRQALKVNFQPVPLAHHSVMIRRKP